MVTKTFSFPAAYMYVEWYFLKQKIGRLRKGDSLRHINVALSLWSSHRYDIAVFEEINRAKRAKFLP
jgi:hypothetical protein